MSLLLLLLLVVVVVVVVVVAAGDLAQLDPNHIFQSATWAFHVPLLHSLAKCIVNSQTKKGFGKMLMLQKFNLLLVS
jgi:hypothetical protein